MASPWSKNASSSPVTFPPPPATFTPPPLPPAASSIPPRSRRYWPWAVAALFVVVSLSAGLGSAVTYLAARSDRGASMPPSAPPTAPTPQFSATETAAAKQNLCTVFDGSVGHEGQGGFRVEGKVNVPVTLQAVTSAIAVEHALGPAVPPDVNAAARRYIDATLAVTTATMGGRPTSEVNRLTDASNEAIDALADACGLPK